MRNEVRLRDVEPAELPVPYEHQLDADQPAPMRLVAAELHGRRFACERYGFSGRCSSRW